MRLVLACVALLCVPVLAGATRPSPAPAPILFPVVGPVHYQDDFGAPRAGGPHQGNDILAAKKSIAVAVESGTVSFWTTSATAGCMLYLHGDSGTVYDYIHLNNDRTMKNDNLGKCVAGTAYAPGLKDGARVVAGQQVGYVGDSGDADGTPHLHFEVHPSGGKAVDPYAYLQAATPLLFYAKPGAPFAATITGTVMSATTTTLQVQVKALHVYPSGWKATNLTKPLTLSVPATALVEDKTVSSTPAAPRSLAASVGRPVTVFAQPALATLQQEEGADGALSAAIVQLG